MYNLLLYCHFLVAHISMGNVYLTLSGFNYSVDISISSMCSRSPYCCVLVYAPALIKVHQWCGLLWLCWSKCIHLI